MNVKMMSGRVKAVAAGAAVLAVAGAGVGGAVAAGQITTKQIKDGTIQTQDLTKNNFARFTATENVTTAVTPANPVAGNRPVVPVAAGTAVVPLTQIVLNKGTYKISGTAQFFDTTANDTTTNYGKVTVSGLADSLGSFYTPALPVNGVNAAQTSFEGVVTITAANTPVIVYGTVAGGSKADAGAQITATQYKYVKLFDHGSK